jgi:DNA-binding MarR family transcriptional regulator
MQAQLNSSIARELSRSTGLSDADHKVLRALSDAPDQRLRARSLRDQLQWEKSRLSHHVSRMEQRGMIERVACEEDSRGSDIRLTHTGRKVIAEACSDYSRIVRDYLIDALTPEQLDSLADISETILQHSTTARSNLLAEATT